MPIAEPLLAWYDAHKRDLPWRRDAHDPYRVWLSEIMLQQTTVGAATAYYHLFTTRWPRVAALAAADDADVMQAWAGLGYYARARNLLACARAIMTVHGGQFPDTEAALRTLPGIGQYTAAAIAAIAFGRRAVVVDGNIERVMARLFAVATPLPAAKPELYRLTDAMTPASRAGDFAQALMDLGSSLCKPRRADCSCCPLRSACAASTTDPLRYPVRLAKPAKPVRTGTVWWIERDGAVWLVRRPARGLLGGMMGFPGSDWTVGSSADDAPPPLATITHGFTHFHLMLNIVEIAAPAGCVLPPGGEWWHIDRLEAAGLPSVFEKVVRAVRESHRQCRIL